jgi:membrane associated rhomboid family serine protease
MPNWLNPVLQIFQPLLPRRGYAVTPSLVGIQVLLWLLMVIQGQHPLFPDSLALLDWGANLGARVAHGEIWRLFSGGFLHAGVAQLAFNMAVLAVLGMSLEWRMGYLRFFLAYLITGALAGLCSALMSGQVVSVGAAGALFGLIGVNISLLMLKAIPPKFKRAALLLLPLFLLANVFNFSFLGVDHWANLGGFTAGLLLAPFLRIGMRPVRAKVPETPVAEEEPDSTAVIEIAPLPFDPAPEAEPGEPPLADAPAAELPADTAPLQEEEAPLETAADVTADTTEIDPPLVLPVPDELRTFGEIPPGASPP